MTPRCFLAIGGIGPRRSGGDSFSNVKAGIVYPLVVELKHSWNSPRFRWMNRLWQQIVPSRLTQVELFKHKLCQIAAICVALRSSPRNLKVVRRCSKPISRHSKTRKPALR